MTDHITIPRALLEQALEALELRYAPDDILKIDAAKIAIRAELAKPVEQVEPFAHTTGVFSGRFTVEPVNRATVIPEGIALYLHPHTPAWHDATEVEELKAQRDELLTSLKELLSELEYGHACPLTKEKSSAAIAKAEGGAV